jgi:FkbM family methyltransferase
VKVSTAFVKLYTLIALTGFPSSRLGRSLFCFLYGIYKEFLDGNNVEFLRQFVSPTSTIFDVGANIGYYTSKFAKFVSSGGYVVAIEPEDTNVRDLRAIMLKKKIDQNVRIIHGLAADRDGFFRLKLNKYHPAGHSIAAEGVEVLAHTIDGLAESFGVDCVSLIKIDVEGAEEMVLKGSFKTISRWRPHLFIEIDDDNLKKMGSSALRVLTLVSGWGYDIHIIENKSKTIPLSIDEALMRCQNGKSEDFLMVPLSKIVADTHSD